MGFSKSLLLRALVVSAVALGALAGASHNGSALSGIEFPDHTSFNAVSSSSSAATDCGTHTHQQVDLDSILSPKHSTDNQSVKLHLNRQAEPEKKGKSSVVSSTLRDSSRIQTLHRRIAEKKNRNTAARVLSETKGHHQTALSHSPAPAPAPAGEEGQVVATLESGVGFGSGEYFMDVFVGTPARHFRLILDTGSDLNWIQCAPCHDCFEQSGPHYDPSESSSYRNVSCGDPRCRLVSPPDPPRPCRSPAAQSCPYYYWYGDSSNTTGDFALEAFTVNVTRAASGRAESRRVENVMFGCGHWNRGLFRGAAGLLGLGRGPLSFASQLQSLYGHSFSYCLVDRNSDANVTSKLVFGEDKALLSHPQLNFTGLISGKENPVDTFYYVDIKSIMVGNEILNISEGTWKLSQEGFGGTIIDSGTTLSYFADQAYQVIREAFLRKVDKRYEMAQLEDFPLDVCYNVSGVEKMELPDFGIVFSDGAVWNFPVENYFIQIEPQEVVCLAFKNTSASGLSIIGNYQQQNFHILYDTKKSRLGYAPMKCAEL